MTGSCVVMLDACLLINLLLVDRADILSDLSRYEFRITEMVMEEIRDETQAAAVGRLIEEGALHPVGIDDAETIGDVAELCQTLGRGEASCMSVARRDGLAVGTDDAKAASLVEGLLGPGHALSTPGLLVEAVRAGLISVAEADRIKYRLEEMRFRMDFDSFSEFV